MNIKKSIDLVEVVIDEIALEGLDGITLEALWQRVGIRLSETLPLQDCFMDQIWKICLEIQDFTFYELENARENLIIFDRYELEYLNPDLDKEYEKDIYEHFPIEDTKLGIRGSCSTYYTRKNILGIVKSLSLSEANEKYGQKLVIVASQILRERALIADNVSPTLHLPLTHYCLLERIGRARKIGEVTIKKNCTIKEDAKTLFYIRKGLQVHGLIRKQVYYQGNTGTPYNGQNTGTLIHLTRFFNTRKPKVIMWAEHLINYLKCKENYAAEYNEVKTELNLDYSVKKFFKIHMLQKVFRTDVKVPYRSYFPNSAEKEWQVKSNTSKERIIKLVTLADLNIEISDLWRTEEVKEDDDQYQVDTRNQKLNVPFLKQIYTTVESNEFKGASQTQLATNMGFTKLISRTLVRNLVKTKIVSTYLDDVGRQRTTKFVSRKFEAKSSLKKRFDVEISKIKEYSQAVQNQKEKPESVHNEIPNIEKSSIKAEELTASEPSTLSKEDLINDDFKDVLLSRANNIFRKYKLFKNQNRYRYTSSANRNKKLKQTNSKTGIIEKKTIHNDLSDKKEVFNENSNIDAKIVDSDFYKTIETKLVIQKPECKKKSEKIAVVGFMENVHNSQHSKQLSISYRLLRRANLIIESVKEHKVITDTQKLMKYIHAEEDKEGLDVKLDKNSLIRLLQKLAKDNFIKYIKLILRNKKQTKQKIVNFICDPNIDENDSVIQSAVEQAKLKFCIMENQVQKICAYAENTPSIYTSNSIIRPLKEKFVVCRNNALGKKHGYSPKFIRMRAMHLFLYHLIYDHPQKCVKNYLLFEKLKNEGTPFEDFLNDDSHIYTSEINWKMFIPPLPTHRGYPLGWALMCDVLLRMPLSVFIKVHNVNYEVPGLQELLDHPIKKHMLVKDVPTPIRNMMFLKRKYMFSIHEIVMKLCYIGLVQFGPQMLKEKDQVFVYLNRQTELMDTTSSAAGYHKIEDKPYPVTKFTFTSLAVVENYWYEMWNTCINTCLGGRSVVEGKDILLEDLSRKIEMIQALKVRMPDEAAKYDIGFVPGDRKGAAGIDSAFFSHLKRNWNWVTNSQKNLKKNRPMQSIKLPRTTTRTLAQMRKAPQLRKRSSPLKPNQHKSLDSSKTQAKSKREKSTLNLDLSVSICSKPPKIIRKVLPRKNTFRKRVKYDEIDFSALQRMDKLRVDWEQHEDNILLVCKVAMVYLCPNPRRNIVTFTAIRDILRSYSFTSYNKTSRACQRRLLYMLKQSKTVTSVLLGVEEVKQDYFINKRFGKYVDCPREESENQVDYEKRMEKVFKDLVTFIAKKYYNISNMEQREPVALPKTIQEFNIFHKLKLPTKTITTPGISKEVREINDIHTATINSVIHSSMCCGKERRSWAYQLFKVYQQYPEYLLRSAMLKIRADQMVTMKKNYMCAQKKFGNCMPMSSSQYQLSSAYYYKFQTKWPYEVFSEAYSSLFTLFENFVNKTDERTSGVEVKPSSGGIVATIHDFVGSDNMDIDIEIPDQIIMLDPGLPEKDEVYQRIALRYQAILEGLSSDYTEHLKNSTNNNEESDIIMSEINSDNIEQVSINNDQQSFVEIRSAKRPLEHNYCSLQTKKQKLDNRESQNETNERNEKCISEVENIHEETQSIVETKFEKTQLLVNKPDNNITPLVNHNQETPMDVDYHVKQLVSTGTIESVHKDTQPIDKNISNEKIVSAIVSVITNVQSSLQDDNSHKEKSQSLIESSNTKLQSTSNELDNMNNKESRQIIDTSMPIQCFSSESAGPDIINKKSESTNMNVDTFFSESLDKKDSSEKTEPTKIASVRVSDLMKRANSLNAVDNVETRVDMHDVRTRQTRIAMLKMREELHDLTFHDSHHAHEYFVVNSFKLFYSLTVNDEDREKVTTYRGMKLPKKLLPIDVEEANKVLNDIKKFAVFPKNPMSYDDFSKEILEEKVYVWNDINVICKFIKAKSEFGATLNELVTNFGYFNNLADILSLLSEKRIILRAGIVTVRYIYFRFVNPWIIHSYKILRLEKECHQTVPEGSVYVLDNEDNTINKDKEGKRVTTAANLFYNSSSDVRENLKQNSRPEKERRQDSLEKSVDEKADNQTDLKKQIPCDNSNETKNLNKSASQENNSKVETGDKVDENLKNQKRIRRNRTVLLKQKDIYRAAKLLDFNTAEEIKVVIKPWIRIDGVLNRRVLDRMLGAVLCYCIEKPGLSLTAVQNRFTPAIQPYHTRELIEILVKLGCVKTIVQKVPKATLFSKPAQLDFNGNPDLVANSDSIIIEPTIQATLRFGMFLSNKSYSLDFLSSL